MWHAWERSVYKVLMRKPEGRRPLGRPSSRRGDWIRMDLRKIGWGSVEWIQVVHDKERWRAVVNTVMNLRVLAPRS
jgi:ribosome biogenesis protein Nip4